MFMEPNYFQITVVIKFLDLSLFLEPGGLKGSASCHSLKPFPPALYWVQSVFVMTKA